MYNETSGDWSLSESGSVPDLPGDAFSEAVPVPPLTGNSEVTPDLAAESSDAGNPSYGTARFLNSASGYEVTVRIGSAVYAPGLSFGELTGYELVPDGFRTVRVYEERDPSVLLLQKTIPFRAGDVVTIVIVRTAAGLDLVQVSDTPCKNRPTGMACVRMANMSYNAPGLDLILDGNKLIFTDVRYKEVSLFKQARPKRYRFTIASTINIPTPYDSDIETIEEMPRLLPAYILGLRPAVTFSLSVKEGMLYTIYVMGSWRRPRIKIVVNRA